MSCQPASKILPIDPQTQTHRCPLQMAQKRQLHPTDEALCLARCWWPRLLWQVEDAHMWLIPLEPLFVAILSLGSASVGGRRVPPPLPYRYSLPSQLQDRSPTRHTAAVMDCWPSGGSAFLKSRIESTRRSSWGEKCPLLEISISAHP